MYACQDLILDYLDIAPNGILMGSRLASWIQQEDDKQRLNYTKDSQRDFCDFCVAVIKGMLASLRQLRWSKFYHENGNERRGKVWVAVMRKVACLQSSQIFVEHQIQDAEFFAFYGFSAR